MRLQQIKHFHWTGSGNTEHTVRGHISKVMPLFQRGWINHYSWARPGWSGSAGKATCIQGHVDVCESAGKQAIHPSWKPFTDGRWHVLTGSGICKHGSAESSFHSRKHKVWKRFHQCTNEWNVRTLAAIPEALPTNICFIGNTAEENYSTLIIFVPFLPCPISHTWTHQMSLPQRTLTKNNGFTQLRANWWIFSTKGDWSGVTRVSQWPLF